MEELTRLIREDMKPALGVTEPGAIAFAVASAKKYVQGEVKRVRVALNSGMYKNAFTCGIPNSIRFGNLYAAALGAVAANADKGLESLADIRPEDDDRAAAMVDAGMIEVCMDHIGSEITIDASVETEEGCCTVRIRDEHTRIIEIEKNGVLLYQKQTEAQKKESDSGKKAEEEPIIHRYLVKEIFKYAKEVPEDEIGFIREAFSMNLKLLEEGLASERAVIAHALYEENGGRIIGENCQKTAQLLCGGAIEARVLGLSRPAMSITGSGAHGIIATMPLFACMKTEQRSEEILLRATALSYLITMYIKEYSGKLSAFCGCGIAAGTGMACGLAFMRGGREEEISRVIWNMASGLTGMICDGGNHGCAMKGIVATDAAFRAVELAEKGICIEAVHGINGRTPEDTMRFMGKIASPGMEETEKTIVEIMEQK